MVESVQKNTSQQALNWFSISFFRWLPLRTTLSDNEAIEGIPLVVNSFDMYGQELPGIRLPKHDPAYLIILLLISLF